MIWEKQVNLIKSLIKQWLSHRDINKQTGISLGTISNVRNNNVKSKPKKFKKIISLFDIHYPYNINLDWVLEFMREEEPDEIIIWWDAVDLFTISKYYDGWIESGIYEANDEIVWFKEIFKEIIATSPKAKIVYFIGNHEVRATKMISKNPRRRNLLSIEDNYKDLVDEFIKYNWFYRTWDLYHIHWYRHWQNFLDTHFKDYLVNIAFWHLHKHQQKSYPTMVWAVPKVSISRWCLCELNPEYQQNRPSAWENWFGYTLVYEDWSFIDNNIKITDWKFLFWDKIYG